MSFKRASLLLLAVIITGTLLPALAVFIVDPYQIYHKRIVSRDAGYGPEEFYTHAGWINQLLTDPDQHFSALVIGPSTMSNYTSDMIDDILHWGKTLNLSYHGGVPRMSGVTASYALGKSASIKHILWDIHLYYANEPANFTGGADFPFYLYNNNLFDDWPYIFNGTNVQTAWQFARGDYGAFEYDLAHSGPFYEGLRAAGRFEVYKSQDYRKTVMLPAIHHLSFSPMEPEEIQQIKYPSININLLKVIMPLCNKDTEIDLIFSPYTRYFYSSIADIRYVYTMVYMRRYVVERTTECKNIHVFAFDNDDDITANLDHYADNFHFDTGINRLILSSIANQDHLLTPANIEQYEKNFLEKLSAYPDEFTRSLAP